MNEIDRRAIYWLWHGCCAYCARPLTRQWQADHILPSSRGGASVLVNFAASCQRCNAAKKNRTAAEIGRSEVTRQAVRLNSLVVDYLLREQEGSLKGHFEAGFPVPEGERTVTMALGAVRTSSVCRAAAELPALRNSEWAWCCAIAKTKFDAQVFWWLM